MQQIFFSDGTREIEIENITGFAGLNMPPMIARTTKGYLQHGATIQSVTYEPRPFTISFDIDEDTFENAALKRADICSFFSSLTPKTMRYVRGALTLYLDEIMPADEYDTTAMERTLLSGTLKLVAYNPFFYQKLLFSSAALETALLEYIDEDGGIEYIDEDGGIEYSTVQQSIVVNNTGKSDQSPAIIRFIAPADAPWVTNTTTGQTIKVDTKLEEGEILEINTKENSVEIIDADGKRHQAFSYISDEADKFDFILLAEGKNIFTFGSEGASVGYIEVGGYAYFTNI
jgi:hypothetical protein